LMSIEANYPNRPPLYIYYHGSDSDMLSFLHSFTNMHLLRAEDLVQLPGNASLGEVDHAGVYWKYTAWSALFDSFDQVLYLDVDVLVLQPLDYLFGLDCFFAVENYETLSSVQIFLPKSANDAHLMELLRADSISFPKQADMCNAGVLLIPKRYRTPEHLNKLLDITGRYASYLQYADQSAISLWCLYQAITLSSAFDYNFQAYFFGSELANEYSADDIKILHFTSKKKPDQLSFMMWPLLPKSERWRLSRLFHSYVDKSQKRIEAM
jgi:lipopolysaccharide biosynthesis glycosyltransferase